MLRLSSCAKKESTEAPGPEATAATTGTSKLPVGSEFSVRTNEAIDSGKAEEGQTFEAQVARDAKDANGDVVIPRGSTARVVIKSASRGGRFHGAVAGGGRGAAIGTGAGARTQVLTKGGAIKAPAESVLAFQPDQPLRVSAVQ